ncbi:esterase-like activity of phytase family protein, partial [Micromonospora yasonensis]|uniref:esterase-like activity of phytase family protein n=1 Tax=Micromonospora yasonensis TaxID=1128667 RepID=UPI00222FB2AE
MGQQRSRWRWVIAGPAAAAALLVAASGPATADPSPRPSPVHGSPVCQVRDGRLTEISGMAATDDGFVMVNDSADEERRRRIFFLDSRCRVVRTVRYPSRPRDTEDLAVAADGTVWIADIGDNDRSRETVAVWKLPRGGERPVLHRLAYPDGPHDAEALLLTGDGWPLVVTKQGGAAGIYTPTRAPVPGATVPMVRRGQVALPGTGTSNPFGFLGRAVVTGAAATPDGRRVVLRTYADAFEFDVPDGDVAAALTTGRPRVVPLPDEPQGESISYTPDGRFLLTVSETADQPAGTRPTVLRYPAPRPATT